jgi:hypothetical protein
MAGVGEQTLGQQHQLPLAQRALQDDYRVAHDTPTDARLTSRNETWARVGGFWSISEPVQACNKAVSRR